jgi:hypothetical protein
MCENCESCTCELEETEGISLADILGIKQSWTKDGSAVFAFVAWAVGIAILLFGNLSSQEVAIAIGGCLFPAFVSALISYKK